MDTGGTASSSKGPGDSESAPARSGRPPGRHADRRIQTICLLTLTALALGVTMSLLSNVLIPFVLALFLVYCLTPVVEWLMRVMRIGRVAAMISTTLLGVVLLVGLWLLIWESIDQINANSGKYERNVHAVLELVGEWLPEDWFEDEPASTPADGDEPAVGADPARIAQPLTEPGRMIRVPTAMVRSVAASLVTSLMGILSNGILVLVFMIFILMGSSHQTLPPDSFRGQVEARVKRYLVTKVLVSGTTGILVGATLTILDVDLALAFGVMTFLLNFIPNIGSFIATLLPLPIVFLNPEMGLTVKVLAIAIPGTIQFAVGNIIEPKMMGESLDLHPVVVLMGLILFGTIWGIVGMFLATPMIAVVKIILERNELTAPVGHVLAGRLEALAGSPQKSRADAAG